MCAQVLVCEEGSLSENVSQEHGRPSWIILRTHPFVCYHRGMGALRREGGQMSSSAAQHHSGQEIDMHL